MQIKFPVKLISISAIASIVTTLTLLTSSVAQAQPRHMGPGVGPAHRYAVVRCESPNGRYRECRLPARGHVTLVRQISGARCIPGRTFGNARNPSRMWVSGGCRGDFAQR